MSTNKNTGSIAKNTAFGIAAQVTHIVTRIVLTPVVIAFLDIEGYGIWAVIMVMTNFMRLGVAGGKSAFQKYASEAMGTGDYESASKLLSTGSMLILVLSLFGLLPLAVFSRKFVFFLGVPDEFIGSAARAIAVLAVVMVLSNVGGVYESIIIGANRIDIVAKVSMLFSISEAVVIIAVLTKGYGLYQMAWVIAASEVGRLLTCYVISSHVFREIRIGACHVSRSMIPELIRFAGSYQVMNLLNLLYVSLLPLVMLKLFGAEVAGAFALCNRLVRTAMLVPEALLLPLLSAASYAQGLGKQQHVRNLMTKALKFTITTTIPSLGFLVLFGNTIVFAWTGKANDLLSIGLLGISFARLFRAIARVCMVLYRALGKASKDVVSQLLRIVVLGCSILVARKFLGFSGVLTAYALAELVGMIYLFYTIGTLLDNFARRIIRDTLVLITSTGIGLFACIMVTNLPVRLGVGERIEAVIRLLILLVTFILAGGLVMWRTGYLSPRERQAVVRLFSRDLSGTNKTS